MKRRAFTPTKINTIIPRRGMCVQAYMSRSDVGSGVRAYVIIGVSPRYITLFYTPRLYAFKIKPAAWPTIAAVEYRPSLVYLINRIVRNIALYRRANMRFNHALAQKTLEILRAQLTHNQGNFEENGNA